VEGCPDELGLSGVWCPQGRLRDGAGLTDQPSWLDPAPLERLTD